MLSVLSIAQCGPVHDHATRALEQAAFHKHLSQVGRIPDRSRTVAIT